MYVIEHCLNFPYIKNQTVCVFLRKILENDSEIMDLKNKAWPIILL